MSEWVNESFFLKRTNELLFSYISGLSVEEPNHPNIVPLSSSTRCKSQTSCCFNWSSLYFCPAAHFANDVARQFFFFSVSTLNLSIFFSDILKKYIYRKAKKFGVIRVNYLTITPEVLLIFFQFLPLVALLVNY